MKLSEFHAFKTQKKRLEWGNIQVFFSAFLFAIIIAQTVIAINNYFTYTQSLHIMVKY